jgi:hypothetical protein
MPTTEEYLHQSSSVRGDGCGQTLREGMAKPEILEFGAVAEGLVINVPSPYLVVPQTANMYFIAAGEESWLRITIESKGCRNECGSLLARQRHRISRKNLPRNRRNQL